MKISIVTDEVSSDPETAIELAAEWGVHDLELRGFETNRVPLLTPFQKERIGELLEEYHASIIALSPGLFKFAYPARERERFPLRSIDAALYKTWRDAKDLVRYHLKELLPATLEYARAVGTRLVVIFSFDRGSDTSQAAPDEVVETLHDAAEQAAKAEIELAIEVEDRHWADVGARAAELVKRIGHPNLGINWDPGNAFAANDEPYPTGYQAVRQYVRHVHFKDVQRLPDGKYCYAVQGEIDWPGQIQALTADHYTGYISVETHMQPKVNSAKAAVQRLRALIDEERVAS
jgi:sugar phosphate isomerase/epimerase